MPSDAQTDAAVDHYLKGAKFPQEERWDEALAAQTRAIQLKSDLARGALRPGRAYCS